VISNDWKGGVTWTSTGLKRPRTRRCASHCPPAAPSHSPAPPQGQQLAPSPQQAAGATRPHY
jgi:hypothetical protein